MLIDDVIVAGFPLSSALRRCIVFNISDVMAWLMANCPQAKSMRSAVPNVAPLAASSWFEWDVIGTEGVRAFGAAFLIGYDAEAAISAPVSNVKDGVRWGMRSFFFSTTPDDPLIRQAEFTLEYEVHRDGSLGDSAVGSLAEGKVVDELTRIEMYALASPCLFATCFAHCRGVTMNDRQQPRQQRRAAERAGRPPLVTYKTIDIEPVTRILRDEGDIEHNGIKKALHICRGHFAHYTEDAPLFGKHTGTYYKPMHVRGSLKQGVVVKDYNVTDKAAKVGSKA